ncbi:MAG: phage portal protein [Candidatus Eisenbacteria sp.]|nr:phage portal protein [Candidatus Eisenbacteria bacterium]
MLSRVRRALSLVWRKVRGIKLSAATYLSTQLTSLYAATAAGPVVTEATAMNLSAVWACVNVHAGTRAGLPIHLLRKEGQSREVITDHPVVYLLSDPNPGMTWFEFRETMDAHAVTFGNAYAEIQRDAAGFPVALWPLLPDRTWPERDKLTRQLQYRTCVPGGRQVILPAHLVLHYRGLGFDGLVGYSVIRQARESLGHAMATEEFGSRFFANGVKPSGVLEHPSELGDVGFGRLQKSMAEHQGLENSHRYMILEEGMKWRQTSLSPDDAQFLETRAFSIPEICRWFRVQPHKVMDYSHAHYTNIEHSNIDNANDTHAPWCSRWDQALSRRLLTRDERRAGLYIKTNLAGLMRGDFKSQNEGFAVGRQWGWWCADDVREMFDKNPLPDGQGQIFLNPMNMVPAGQLVYADKGQAPKDPSPSPSQDDDEGGPDGAAEA